MKRNIQKFNRLIRNGFINPDDFYAISISEYDISLQGYYKQATLLKYDKQLFKFGVSQVGYFEACRGNVKIILTDK